MFGPGLFIPVRHAMSEIMPEIMPGTRPEPMPGPMSPDATRRHDRLFQLLHDEQRAERLADAQRRRPQQVARGDALLLQSLASASLRRPPPAGMGA